MVKKGGAVVVLLVFTQEVLAISGKPSCPQNSSKAMLASSASLANHKRAREPYLIAARCPPPQKIDTRYTADKERETEGGGVGTIPKVQCAVSVMLVLLIPSNRLHVFIYHAGRGPVVHYRGGCTGCLSIFWRSLSSDSCIYDTPYSSLGSMNH